MIVVTTPTGNIGGKILTHLLASNESVRVIVRDASRLPATIRERVDIVEGSHGDAVVVDKAFQGADSVFWLAPPDPKTASPEAAYLDFTRPACKAFRTHGVQRVVAVSTLGRGTPWQDHAGFSTTAFQMCDLIAASGVHLRSLALPGFMDNFPIRYQQVTSEAFQARLFGHGASEGFANGLTEMFEAKAKGLDNAAPRTPESTTPTTFRQWAEDHLVGA